MWPMVFVPVFVPVVVSYSVIVHEHIYERGATAIAPVNDADKKVVGFVDTTAGSRSSQKRMS
jgi:hypothetical protein